MALFAQIPGASQVVENAAAHGWEAGLLAAMVVAMAVSFGYTFRIMWKRETRLSDRITQLENSIEETMLTLVKETTAVVTAATETNRNVIETNREVRDSVRTLVAMFSTTTCYLERTGQLSDETQQRINRKVAAANAEPTQS